MAQIKLKVTHEQLQIGEKIVSLEVQKLQFILIYIIYLKLIHYKFTNYDLEFSSIYSSTAASRLYPKKLQPAHHWPQTSIRQSFSDSQQRRIP